MRRPASLTDPRALLPLLLLTAACTSVPRGLVVSPPSDPLARRVASLAEKTKSRLGIAALHVETGRRLAWNADEVFEAASVYKLGLLAEAAARVKEHRLELTDRWRLTEKAKAAPSSFLLDFDPGLEPTQRDLLYLMIGRSDNTATNHFFDLFGKDAVNERMAALGFPKYRMVGRIPDRDPEETQDQRWKGLALGQMTPGETAEYYRRVVTGTLLGGASDRLIWNVLSSQHQLDRIPRLLLDLPGATWAGKTGTKRAVRVDSGVLTTKKGHFVLVVFADRIPETPGATVFVNRTMGEIARAIVEAWSRDLPDLPPPPPPVKDAPALAFALPRVEVSPLEAAAAGPYEARVFRPTDELFWKLWKKAGGDVRDDCLLPMPNSWWEGEDGFKIEPLSAIVLHHTGSATDESAISYFLDPASLVSSHFLVGRDGRLYQFVSLEHRAWHAGSSLLHGRRVLNRTSVGVEITGDGNLGPFTRPQIESVVRLVGVLTAMYDVKAPWIAGHQHIAPWRKPDPGELFPWNEIVRRALELAETLKAEIPPGFAGPS